MAAPPALVCELPVVRSSGLTPSPDCISSSLGLDAKIQRASPDSLGGGYIDFGALVALLHDPSRGDWPRAALCTTLWVLNFICRHSGTAQDRRAKWKAEAFLEAGYTGVELLLLGCRLRELMFVSDQLHVTNAASMESFGRALRPPVAPGALLRQDGAPRRATPTTALRSLAIAEFSRRRHIV